MGRAIAAVILGYLTMFVAIFATFTGVYLALGTEKTYKPASFEPSMLWNIISIVLGLIAAVFGGIVCAAVAKRRPKPVMALAILVFVLGIGFALPTLATKPDPGPRTGDIPNLEAMAKTQTPAWVAFLNPVIGVVGVMIGGTLMSPKPGAP